MYFSEEEKEQIKKEAAAEGKSVSTYCRDIVQDYRFDRTAEDLDAEERLERMLAEGTERWEEIAETIDERTGLMIHILREIEADLEGVDVDADLDLDEENSDLAERLGDRE